MCVLVRARAQPVCVGEQSGSVRAAQPAARRRRSPACRPPRAGSVDRTRRTRSLMTRRAASEIKDAGRRLHRPVLLKNHTFPNEVLNADSLRRYSLRPVALAARPAARLRREKHQMLHTFTKIKSAIVNLCFHTSLVFHFV